jgi:hypothetical protein
MVRSIGIETKSNDTNVLATWYAYRSNGAPQRYARLDQWVCMTVLLWCHILREYNV